MSDQTALPLQHEQEFAASLLRLSRSITPAMRQIATRHIIDFLGVAIAGLETQSVDTVRSLLSIAEEPDGGRVLGSPARLSMSDAILVNAMAGHIHDFDDDETLLSIAHVTVPVTAAAWTYGERIGASGEQIVAAYVTGVEAMMRIGQIVNPAHYRKGWHSSATLGGLGAATAIAVLSGFDETRMLHALRFAASMSSGIRKSFGSDAKSIQLGRSAANGYFAAQLAGAGSTTSEGMLFGPQGFVGMYDGDATQVPDAIAAMNEQAGVIAPGITIKAYPCCTATHTAIESVLTLARDHAIDWSEIARITVTMGVDLPSVLPYDRPHRGLEGKFSMRYCAAAAARFGRMGIAEFTDDATQEAGVQRMLDRTQVVVDHDTPRPAVGLADHARVVIEMTSGNVYERFLAHTLGSVQRPIPEPVLQQKYLDCTTPVIGAEMAMSSYVALRDLSLLTDVSGVFLLQTTIA
ncbi:MAG TPA: MmgE/PrpD family protein [Paraburkholderia sp.]|nr:MmgE/PrpD family protein [Paraburkholderia sp.]